MKCERKGERNRNAIVTRKARRQEYASYVEDDLGAVSPQRKLKGRENKIAKAKSPLGPALVPFSAKASPPPKPLLFL